MPQNTHRFLAGLLHASQNQYAHHMPKKRKARRLTGLLAGAREKIRTPGLLIRSQTLYPAELRAQS